MRSRSCMKRECCVLACQRSASAREKSPCRAISHPEAYACSRPTLHQRPPWEPAGWSSNQHSSLEKLHKPWLVDRKAFDELVSLRFVDMNAIPAELHGKFDLVWSLCSLEHVGSTDLLAALWRSSGAEGPVELRSIPLSSTCRATHILSLPVASSSSRRHRSTTCASDCEKPITSSRQSPTKLDHGHSTSLSTCRHTRIQPSSGFHPITLHCHQHRICDSRCLDTSLLRSRQ